MRKTLFYGLLAVAILVFPGASGSRIVVSDGFLTGNDFLDYDEREQTLYAMGLVDGMALGGLLGAPEEGVLAFADCVQGMRSDQIAAMLRNQLDDNPQNLHHAANRIFWGALPESCRSKIMDSLESGR